MCGICGLVDWESPPPTQAVADMVKAMRNRGPDASGVVRLGPAVLGHARLSVIDLSEAANQPMADVSGRFHIVLNGEIYNFKALRKELESLGARFRTASDTEVALEAYKAWGVDCLQRFNGMFALAVWDGPGKRLFLARDRLGKKPLFYHLRHGGGVVFASDLRALVHGGNVPREVSAEALYGFLALNYVLSSQCMVKDVRKLPPGHYVVLERDLPKVERSYWDLASSFRNKRRYAGLGEAVEEFRALFNDAVALRLACDVPLGAFLSGGLDSSSIVAEMALGEPSGGVRTFSMGFAERGYSELRHSSLVARYLDVEHHADTIPANPFCIISEALSAFDEPFADTSMVPTYQLSRFARKQVTVALSGDGGDEILAGYTTYNADRLRHLVGWLPGGLFRGLGVLMGLLPADFGKVSAAFKARQFFAGCSLPPAQAHCAWRRILWPDSAAALAPGLEPGLPDPEETFEAFDADVAGCHYLDRAMYMDIKTWLVDDVLVKVDRCSMANSLEVRSPLLDHRLVEFAAQLPINMKMGLLHGKRLLRAAMVPDLPDAVFRRCKAGFNAPVSHWLAKGLDELLENPPHPFDDRQVQYLLNMHRARRKDNSLPLFGVIAYAAWARSIGV